MLQPLSIYLQKTTTKTKYLQFLIYNSTKVSWEKDNLQTINLEQKGMKRYNLSKDEINYCNINA